MTDVSDPTLKQLQARVKAFSDARDWARFHSPRNLAMALSVEAAELLELYLWSADDGPQPLHPDRAPRVAAEAADVLMCLLNLCERADIDLAAALDAKLAEAARKYPVERVRGKALKYDEYAGYHDAPPEPSGDDVP
ncbi:MAG: nucleotide pyrophosphohydrolase [Alphaproteobacteria bacterium]|nr:nucleotide pyrophosphohydrolase [Alphaproteobacteria bacterium]